MHDIVLSVDMCAMTCVELTNTTTIILQYSDTVEGSLLTISCLEGYYLPGGDMMSVCIYPWFMVTQSTQHSGR